jgi:hypothetical protein
MNAFKAYLFFLPLFPKLKLSDCKKIYSDFNYLMHFLCFVSFESSFSSLVMHEFNGK